MNVMSLLPPELRILAVDVETTGLSPSRDRLVEIAAVIWQDGREVDAFDALVNPGCAIPHAAMRVHGITDAMVREKPPVDAVLPAFLAFCQADLVIAHNARFDMAFLREACLRAGLTPLALPVHDTCAISRQLLPMSPSHSLESMKRVLGVGAGQQHRALQDARDCLAVFLKLLERGYVLQRVVPPLSSEEEGLLAAILEALDAEARLNIEYRDGRGHTTTRTILPRGWYDEDRLLEAHCFLRNETRHFYLNRIRRVWRV